VGLKMSIKEKAERFTKLRLEPIWDELSTEEKERLIAEAETMFIALKKRREEKEKT